MTPDQVQAELRDLRESIRWRPATELPPDGEAVLVMTSGKYCVVAYHIEGVWEESFGEGPLRGPNWSVAYWMPIPEAPR